MARRKTKVLSLAEDPRGSYQYGPPGKPRLKDLYKRNLEEPGSQQEGAMRSQKERGGARRCGLLTCGSSWLSLAFPGSSSLLLVPSGSSWPLPSDLVAPRFSTRPLKAHVLRGFHGASKSFTNAQKGLTKALQDLMKVTKGSIGHRCGSKRWERWELLVSLQGARGAPWASLVVSGRPCHYNQAPR